MKTTKNLALLSMMIVIAFAVTQMNALGLVQGAVDTAGDIATGAANIASGVVGSPYYRRPVVVRPVVYGGEQYETQVEPGEMVEETYETQVEPGENIEDFGY